MTLNNYVYVGMHKDKYNFTYPLIGYSLGSTLNYTADAESTQVGGDQIAL